MGNKAEATSSFQTDDYIFTPSAALAGSFLFFMDVDEVTLSMPVSVGRKRGKHGTGESEPTILTLPLEGVDISRRWAALWRTRHDGRTHPPLFLSLPDVESPSSAEQRLSDVTTSGRAEQRCIR